MAVAKEKQKAEDRTRRKLVRTILTWGHVITMSVLILAAVCNVGGLAAILFMPHTAEAVTEYVEKWQMFFIAGVLGYDAKSTVENAMKITGSLRALAQETENSESETKNG